MRVYLTERTPRYILNFAWWKPTNIRIFSVFLFAHKYKITKSDFLWTKKIFFCFSPLFPNWTSSPFRRRTFLLLPPPPHTHTYRKIKLDYFFANFSLLRLVETLSSSSSSSCAQRTANACFFALHFTIVFGFISLFISAKEVSFFPVSTHISFHSSHNSQKSIKHFANT